MKQTRVTSRPVQTVHWGSLLFQCAATLAALVGFANIGVVSWVLYSAWTGARPTFNHEWLFLLVQALAWITIAISFRIRLQKSTRRLAYVWWVTTFAVGTFSAMLAVLDLVNKIPTPMVEIVLALATWPVCCVLLACAVLGGRINSLSEKNGLSEPLLNGENGEYANGNGHDWIGEKVADGSTRETAYASAGFFSRLTFLWLDALLFEGYKKALTQDDVPFVNAENRAQAASNKFQEAWDAQKLNNPSKPQSLWNVLASVYGKAVLLNGLFALAKTVTSASGPLVLRFFIDFAAGKQTFRGEGYTLVAILFVAKIVESLAQRHCYFGARFVTNIHELYGDCESKGELLQRELLT